MSEFTSLSNKETNSQTKRELPPTVGEAIRKGFTWEEIFYPAPLQTFRGRVYKFFDMFNTPHLFHTKDYIRSQQKIINLLQNKEDDLDRVSITIARKANSVVSATVHPQTGEIINPFLRMSFQLPYNLLVISAMMSSVGNVPLTMFLHFSNQTYNVFLNYAHRNASGESSNTRLMISYVGAVATSVGAAVGIVPYVQKLKINPISKQILLRVSPLFALSAANIFNLSFMRSPELYRGIAVETEDGEFVGRSRIAGFTAIGQTVTCRIAANLPPMLFSNMVLTYLRSLPTRAINPILISKKTEVSIYLSVILANYWYSLPGTCAFFPQVAKMKTTSLESEFHNKVSEKTGKPIEYVYFNKGL